MLRGFLIKKAFLVKEQTETERDRERDRDKDRDIETEGDRERQRGIEGLLVKGAFLSRNLSL